MNTIYGLVDPRTGMLRYVGVTTQSLTHRYRRHLHEARRGENTHRSAWIRKVLSDSQVPLLLVIEEAKDRLRECVWIAHYRDAGCDLTNATDGGEGLFNPTEEVRAKIRASVTGFRHTSEAKAKIAAAAKDYYNKRTPEEAAQAGVKISAALKGKVISEDHKAKLAAGRLQAIVDGKVVGHHKPHTEEAKARMREALKGRVFHPHTEETKTKMSAAKMGNQAFLGRRHTEETKAKIRAAKMGNTGRLGIPCSEETKAKISAANTGKKRKKNVSVL